ncbi:unnamed protein product [Saccharomyces cerevisiae]|nr:unnamed protein product [Saccharomyces cerevisiae]
MNEDLPKEYFELIRKALNEKEAEKAPLSRRRRVRRKNQPLPDAKKKFKTGLNELPRESVVTVNLDSSDDGVVTVPTDDSVEEIQSSEEDYDSEEFEDVTDGNEVAGVEDISVEIKPSTSACLEN